MSIIDSTGNYALIVDETDETFMVKYLQKVKGEFVYSHEVNVLSHNECDFYITEEEGMNVGGFYIDESGDIKELDPDYEPSVTSEDESVSDDSAYVESEEEY